MSKFFNSMILIGVMTFSFGMFMIGLYQANGSSIELIEMGRSVRVIGIGCGIFGILGNIIQRLRK